MSHSRNLVRTMKLVDADATHSDRPREALDVSGGDVSGLFNEGLAIFVYVLVALAVVVGVKAIGSGDPAGRVPRYSPDRSNTSITGGSVRGGFPGSRDGEDAAGQPQDRIGRHSLPC